MRSPAKRVADRPPARLRRIAGQRRDAGRFHHLFARDGGGCDQHRKRNNGPADHCLAPSARSTSTTVSYASSPLGVLFTIRDPDPTPLTVALIRSDWMVEPAARALLSPPRPWTCSARLRLT